MTYNPFTTHQQRRDLLRRVPPGKTRTLMRTVLSDLSRAENLLASKAVRDALEKLEAVAAVAAMKAGDPQPCKHERRGQVAVTVNPDMGSTDYCLDCKRVLL